MRVLSTGAGSPTVINLKRSSLPASLEKVHLSLIRQCVPATGLNAIPFCCTRSYPTPPGPSASAPGDPFLTPLQHIECCPLSARLLARRRFFSRRALEDDRSHFVAEVSIILRQGANLSMLPRIYQKWSGLRLCWYVRYGSYSRRGRFPLRPDTITYRSDAVTHGQQRQMTRPRHVLHRIIGRRSRARGFGTRLVLADGTGRQHQWSPACSFVGWVADARCSATDDRAKNQRHRHCDR